MNHEVENIQFDLSKIDFKIKSLGKPIYISPIQYVNFVDDNDRIIYNTNYQELLKVIKENSNSIITFEKAGPRERIYFEPEKTVAAIVTCGGLCPGLNNVIRSLVMQLYYQYKVYDIIGIRYGYKGLNLDQKISPIRLNPTVVQDIHNLGGSFLGSSRGYSDAVKIVDALEYYGINVLFTIGGDGTIRGAIKIVEEIEKRGLNISVVGIPKTIDNDIPFISKTFGFETAFSSAVEAIRCAHAEAKGAPNGIGIVKVMGRDSGFIAAQASLAQKDVNYVLIPEIDFDLEGPKGLFKSVEERLKKRGHALIVVAEGSGQKFFEGAEAKYDASGNRILNDIGVYLKNKLKQYFDKIEMEVNIKYIDPSYIIRSVPASPNDSVYCGFLAENAVHAAMAGKTKLIIGKWNESFVHLPMEIVNFGRKKIDPKGPLWRSVLLSTGQEELKNN
ncbi:MAG: ATP-dependent 6-phosphofructokinase [Spirochaetes bacterium]|nr:ATP-dependent 6-phosphofructokinase [Spirochaetota bacterium]